MLRCPLVERIDGRKSPSLPSDHELRTKVFVNMKAPVASWPKAIMLWHTYDRRQISRRANRYLFPTCDPFDLDDLLKSAVYPALIVPKQGCVIQSPDRVEISEQLQAIAQAHIVNVDHYHFAAQSIYNKLNNSTLISFADHRTSFRVAPYWQRKIRTL